MTPSQLLRLVAERFEALQIPYFVTGSVAATYYGEPRMTNDIDVVVRLRYDQARGLLTAFPGPDFYLDGQSISQAIDSHGLFNVIHVDSALKIDLMVAAPSAFNASRFVRVRRILVDQGVTAAFASPEDVILKKLEYFREGGSEKHLRDIAGMVRISGDALDRSYIDDWANRLGLSVEWHRASQIRS